MPSQTKVITEQDTYDVDGSGNPSVPLRVPIGDEWMDDAAEVIERFVQTTGNRFRWLRRATGKLGEINDWLGENTFRQRVNVNSEILISPSSGDTPLIRTERAPSNQWRKLGQFKVADNQYAYLYTGSDGGARGAFAIVLNAYWMTGTSRWNLHDANQKAAALIWRFNDVRVVGRDANSAPWEFWGQNTLTAFGSEVLSQVFRSARMFVNANTDADATNGYRYNSPIERVSCLSLGECWGLPYFAADGSVSRAASGWVNVADLLVWIPIRIPPYCSFREIQIKFQQNQSSGQWDQFQLKRRNGGLNGWENVGGIERHQTSGEVTARLHTGSWQVVKDQEEWAVTWKVVDGSGGSANNRLLGGTIQWLDIGPSNGVG